MKYRQFGRLGLPPTGQASPKQHARRSPHRQPVSGAGTISLWVARLTCDTLSEEDAGMATDLQSRPFAFDTARRYTIEEYYRLVEDGRLEEDARVELLDGRIVGMAPIGPEHQWVVDVLGEAFLFQGHGRFRTSQGRPLPIPVWSVPEPDLMLYRVGSANRQRHVQPEDVFLVVEVAQSTRRRDLIKKAKLYREARIPEYWVVDLKQNCLHVHALEGEGYKETVLEQGSASPRAFADVTIDLAILFGVR